MGPGGNWFSLNKIVSSGQNATKMVLLCEGRGAPHVTGIIYMYFISQGLENSTLDVYLHQRI